MVQSCRVAWWFDAKIQDVQKERRGSLVQNHLVQDLLEYGLTHALEDELHVLGADSACEVSVNNVRRLILFEETGFDKRRSGLEVATPGIVGEAYFQVNSLYLFLEQIGFVQEEDEGGVAEPVAVANLVEQHERLVHSVLRIVFSEGLVVLAKSNTKDDSRDRVEAVNPLSSLAALTSHIRHPETDVLKSGKPLLRCQWNGHELARRPVASGYSLQT